MSFFFFFKLRSLIVEGRFDSCKTCGATEKFWLGCGGRRDEARCTVFQAAGFFQHSTSKYLEIGNLRVENIV